MVQEKLLEIRSIKVDEFGRLAKLIRKLHEFQRLHNHTIKIPNEEVLETELSHEDEKSEIVPNKFASRVIVAVDLQRLNEPDQAYIVGYMIYHHAFSILHGRHLYLTSFFIEENYRRQGLGHKFMDFMRLQGLVMSSSQLDVGYINENYKGIKFYESFGSQACNEEYIWMMTPINYRRVSIHD